MKMQATACNFIKKRLQYKRFPVNIAKFLKTAFYKTPLMAVSGYFMPLLPSVLMLSSILQ